MALVNLEYSQITEFHEGIVRTFNREVDLCKDCTANHDRNTAAGIIAIVKESIDATAEAMMTPRSVVIAVLAEANAL